jgi:tetratricopeptide (TPR) repeat protein
MPEDVMLHEAIEAIRQGQRARARDLLTRLLRADSNNANYWIWMSSVVETGREQIFCLKSALKLEPTNPTALQGLRLMGAIPAEGEVKPAPPVRRKWKVEVQQVREMSTLGRLWANPYVKLAVLGFTAFMVVVLVGFGLYYQGAWRQRAGPVIPTKTPGPSPTYTLTPTAINETPQVPPTMPTFSGPVPLWAKLEATYTPTAIYVSTPHVSNESFRMAQKAFERNDIATALEHLRQAEQVSPDAPDIPYFAGEIHRLQGDYKEALASYTKSLEIDPNFAPAHLGIARTMKAQNPETDISKALQQAVEADPNWIEPSLELANSLIELGEAQQALEILKQVEAKATGSPVFFLRRAQANLALGNNAAALEDARKANELDMTLLESYRMLAYAAAANDEYDQALEFVEIYLTYEENDPIAWMIQGRALYGEKKFEEALEALDKALGINKKLAEARLYRGLTLMELDRSLEAINDVYLAQQTDPRSFALNLYLARAMLEAGRLGDALQQVNRTYDLSKSDAELGQTLYWRAQIYEAIGNLFNAGRDWKALIALPEGSVPEALLKVAREHIETTSTPAPTATSTATFTRTPTITRTPTPSNTSNAVKTPAPSATGKASALPQTPTSP